MEQVYKAKDKDNEDKDYQMWLTMLPTMIMAKNVIDFQEFRKMGTKQAQQVPVNTTKSDEEILKDVETILKIKK